MWAFLHTFLYPFLDDRHAAADRKMVEHFDLFLLVLCPRNPPLGNGPVMREVNDMPEEIFVAIFGEKDGTEVSVIINGLTDFRQQGGDTPVL